MLCVFVCPKCQALVTGVPVVHGVFCISVCISFFVSSLAIRILSAAEIVILALQPARVSCQYKHLQCVPFREKAFCINDTSSWSENCKC